MTVAHFAGSCVVLTDPGVPLRSPPGFMLSPRFAGSCKVYRMTKLRFISPLALLLLLALPCCGCARDRSCTIAWQATLAGSEIPEGFGVNIHFTDPRPGEIKMLSDAGFRWVRMDLKWDLTEKEPGRFDFSSYDR